MDKKKITALIIMDGCGIAPDGPGNAVSLAKTPALDRLKREYPHTQIAASGRDVGLPDGQMGNSEVGHTNMGAGRIVYQDLTRVSKSIEDGDFYSNPAFMAALNHVKEQGKKLHIMGLMSDGGVHSHMDHAVALVDMARKAGLAAVYVHCFMDGRDTPPSSGKEYIARFEADAQGTGIIASVTGRYYAMDRDNRWDRVQRAYDALVLGEGLAAASGQEAMQAAYDRGETDEFVQPTVIRQPDGAPVATIEAGDSVIFFNFRPDRAREITRSLIEPDFSGFARKGGYQPVQMVSLTEYDATFQNIAIAFGPESLTNTLGEYVAAQGKTQLRIAETEKYAHVTFFFNGGVEAPNPGEDRALIPSPKVATYDLQPSMSAPEVAKEAVSRVLSGKYDMMILNFANCDMVGHTGIIPATVEAVETVDICVGRVIDAILQAGGRALITADHGNAEQMIDPDIGGPFTAHTTNPVPLILVDAENTGATLREGGRLSDLAPTATPPAARNDRTKPYHKLIHAPQIGHKNIASWKYRCYIFFNMSI